MVVSGGFRKTVLIVSCERSVGLSRTMCFRSCQLTVKRTIVNQSVHDQSDQLLIIVFLWGFSFIPCDLYHYFMLCKCSSFCFLRTNLFLMSCVSPLICTNVIKAFTTIEVKFIQLTLLTF